VIDVDEFSQFFSREGSACSRDRDTTTSSSPPVFTEVPRDTVLPSFAAVSAADVSAIGRQRDKSSAIDPVPTSALKSIAYLVAPFIPSSSAGRWSKVINRMNSNERL
jgi:hypothetical protein